MDALTFEQSRNWDRVLAESFPAPSHDVPSSTTAGALGRNALSARRFRVLATTRHEKCPLVGSQRGEGRLGCIVSGLAILIFILACFKILPVYLDKVEFEDSLARLASRAGVENWDSDTVRSRVLEAARNHEFQITPKDVNVRRPLRFQPVPEIKIDVKYRRQVEFPGYTHVFHFESRVSSFIGRL